MKTRKANYIPSHTHSFLSLVTCILISSSSILFNRSHNQGYWKNIPSHPSYGHICKRINRLSVDIKKDDWADSDDDDLIIIAADSTGIKVTKEVSGCLTNGVQERKDISKYTLIL